MVLSADNQVKLRRQYRQTCNVADFYEYLGLVEKGKPLILTLTGGWAGQILSRWALLCPSPRRLAGTRIIWPFH